VHAVLALQQLEHSDLQTVTRPIAFMIEAMIWVAAHERVLP
jgi:hypothetical protein